MDTLTRWPWARSLAMSRSGDLVQIDEILFGTIRDYCWERSLKEGSVVICEESDDQWVRVKPPDGGSVRLSRAYAWFVSVRSL